MLDPLCAIAATTKTTLENRIHNLPFELYTMIRDYTFSLDNVVDDQDLDLIIDSNHHIPSIMKVDSETRNALASKLYSRSVYCADHERAAQWLVSLSPAHRAMLKEVRIGSAFPEHAAQMLDSSNYLAKMQWATIQQALAREGAEIDDDVLYFRVSAPVVQDAKKDGSGARRQRVWSNDVMS